MSDLTLENKTTRRLFNTDREIQALKPDAKRYAAKDKSNNGLFIDVKPSGKKAWQYRYSVNGKQETLTLGNYPDILLSEARQKRNDAANLVANNISPNVQKQQERKAMSMGATVYEYGQRYFDEVIKKERANPITMQRILEKDIYPLAGKKRMVDFNADDARQLIWRKKNQGYDAAASQLRGLLKRMFDYAVTLGIVPFNPVLAIPNRHVFKQVDRDRVLSVDEIRTFYTALLDSRIYRPRKLGLLLSLLTLVRKNEMLNARWEHIDFENRIWHIPVTKNVTGGGTGRPMLVYMSDQVVEIFKELRTIAGNEPFVFCGRTTGTRTAHNTLNHAQKAALVLTDVPHFTIHDLRRTASTLLNEKGLHADAIEACLNHTTKGVRGVYNKAVYADIRTAMMQEWSDYVYSIIYEPNLLFFNKFVQRKSS